MRAKKKDFIHISSFLIPSIDEDGKILRDGKSNIIYKGKSKGVTYRRPKKVQDESKKKDHMSLIEDFEKILIERKKEELKKIK